MPDRKLGKTYIKEWRLHRGLSLRRLAQRMEVEPGVELISHASIGRIEKREQPYSQEILEAMAVALGCQPWDLLHNDPTKDGELVRLIDSLTPEQARQATAIIKAMKEAS